MGVNDLDGLSLNAEKRCLITHCGDVQSGHCF